MLEQDTTYLAATGVEGLDHLLRGGFPSRRMYLLEGAPGTGKTTLALQFLLEGRRLGEPCLYVTLSETIEELSAVARSHGWSLEGIDCLQPASFIDTSGSEYTLYHPADVELGDLTKVVFERIETVRPARAVIDSLSELRLLARDPLRYRRQISNLKDFISRQTCTVLMLDDQADGDEDLQLRSLAHGVVRLEQLTFDYGRARRRVRVTKLRGVAAIEGFHDFSIVKGGLRVYPQLTYNGNLQARGTEPIASGLPELDTLLGGGLSWGTTTLLIGPAGSGKSTVAAQYLCGAANPETRGAVFLFDERRRTFLRRCDALGMRATERIASGHLIAEQIDPGEASPGEFSHRVKYGVEHEGMRMVAIDTLNGYSHAILSTDSAMVRMHELLSYLNERGVATLIVLAQHGILGTNMSVPIDLSYLADTVVLFRFFESYGAVRKAISVVKMRTGAHERSIRELRIGPDRVFIGESLTAFHGVLSGIPEYVGPHPLPPL
jgi:circadian clock protein KaiC